MAIMRGQREKASPCIGVAGELGVEHLNVEHHRALPYAEVPAFIATLRGCEATPVTKLAFEWLILTATRSGETRGARWGEIDLRLVEQLPLPILSPPLGGPIAKGAPEPVRRRTVGDVEVPQHLRERHV